MYSYTISCFKVEQLVRLSRRIVYSIIILIAPRFLNCKIEAFNTVGLYKNIAITLSFDLCVLYCSILNVLIS